MGPADSENNPQVERTLAVQSRPFRRMGMLDSVPSALATLRAGKSLVRPLTDSERMALAVASCVPQQHLSISSTLDRAEFNRGLRSLFKRMERRRERFAYFAVVTNARGDIGYHAHVLLWGFQPMNLLAKDARELGVGTVFIRAIKEQWDDYALSCLTTVAYVLGQDEPLFGNPPQLKNEPRKQSNRRYRYPQRNTLATTNPELLAAIDMAKSTVISDDELFRQLPFLDKR